MEAMEAMIDAKFDAFFTKLEAKLDALLDQITPPKQHHQSEKPLQSEQPITPPEPVTPLQPVIALEQPITPPQPPPEPSSIEKEKETSTSSTSDAKPHQASSEDLYKLQTLRQSTRFTRFAPTSAPAPKLSFSAMMPYQQATFVPLPAYIRRAREMEATGQG